jgi:transposase
MILGFDVSKYELVGVLINKRGFVKESYVLENDREKIECFLNVFIMKYPKVIMGSEATGEYHNILAKSCLEKNIPFYLLNPIVTKQFTKATVRKRKTDLTDAHVIAKCILQGEGQLISCASFNSLKPVLRTASRLSRIAHTFNQMKMRFSDHFAKEELIQKELTMLHNNIQESIKRIRSYAISNTDKDLKDLLSSIPGIGETLASVFIAEIGDINRFPNQKTLVAYAGLDPKVRQSGYTLKRNTRLTKRGSPYLRRAAYIASSIAQRHDPELREYYEKKRNEGKRYKEATVANARHILNRIYAVWKRQTPYLKKAETTETIELKQAFPQEKVLT